MLAGESLGIAAKWVDERIAASNGELEKSPVKFESSEGVKYAGVLLLLPFLAETGLFSYRQHYSELKRGYYFLDIIILIIAFMYLCRIKNPEQLKQISPGDFGILLGLDRIPETKCLRFKIKSIVSQEKSNQWNISLVKDWVFFDGNEFFFYIDGHIRKYYGYNAILGKKHVTGQKLCLPGMQEFWVNNTEGLPYFYVTGEVNEKLLEIISEKIVPDLLSNIEGKYTQSELDACPELARFTIVFDREAYSPKYFKKLWEESRIAVITYRKNVKDVWSESDFKEYPIEDNEIQTKMKLAEKTLKLNNCEFREIRKLSKDGHQTSIITTNKQLTLESVAIYMFSRWTQENYFKYLKQDYDFDRLMQYAVESIDSDFVVVNPEYNNLNYKLKKTREKISRRKAIIYNLEQENIKSDIENTSKNFKKQALEKEELDILTALETELLEKRKTISYKIKIEDMPETIKYNKLHTESKHFQNIIKMICYRAETSFSNMLSINYKKKYEEKRMLAKSIINSQGDIIADYENNTLTIKLYSQSNPRMNLVLKDVCEILNRTNFVYPNTNLKMIYKIASF
jgi:hypothetical protein